MVKVRNRIALSFAALLVMLILACVPSFAEDSMQVVKEGVDFESDIIYKSHFTSPTITVSGSEKYHKFRDFNRQYTRVSTVVIIPKHSKNTVEVDYGVVGTVNGKNVKLKLTFSHLVHWPYMNTKSDDMQIYIGDNPTTGFVLDNIYLCKVTYDIRYEDGHLLDDPSLTLDSLNGDKREGAKPINADKMSLDKNTIMNKSGLREPYAVSGVSPSSIESDLKGIDDTGWWYDDSTLAPGEKYLDAGADYIYNPLTGKYDKYNPRTAITCFYEDSSNMQAWITARNGGVWESALVVAKEPEHNLTIKKETNVPSDDEFTFRLKIYRKLEKEETTIVDEQEPEGAAYAVFDSSDNTLTFFRDEAGKYSNGAVSGTKTYYTNFETTKSQDTSDNSVPWYRKRSEIKTVVFENIIEPNHTDVWFNKMTNLTSVKNIENLRMHRVVTAVYMFGGCTALEELDTSKFYTPNLQRCGNMFENCSKLKYLNLSNMDFRYTYYVPPGDASAGYGASGFTRMFAGCSNLTTEIILPVIPQNHYTPFENAATKEGAQIKFKIWIARPLGQAVVNNRSIGTIEELLQGVNGNVKFDGFVKEMYYAPVPDYIGQNHVTHKTEKHIFDLLGQGHVTNKTEKHISNMKGDNKFNYDLDSQTYTFKLKAGESVTIPNIPKSYQYAVEEVHAPEIWEFESCTDNKEGFMDKDETVVFKSKLEYKSLTIKKKTAGNVAGEFDFKIRAWKGDKNLDLSSQLESPDDDGYYHFTLSNAGEKTIPKIPVGYQYEVIEEEKPGWILTKKTNDTGKIEEDVTAEFTNRALHTLKVKKTVAGELGNENKDFDFSIKVYDGNQTMDLSEYLSEHGGKYNESDGTYSFTLKHGEEAVIPDVPYGYHYKIEENDYTDDNYSTEVNNKAAREATGTLASDKEYVFTNTSPAKPHDIPSLTISKKTVDDIAGEFEFKVKAWKDDKKLDLSSVFDQPDGDGYYHFTLSTDDEITIPEIPVGYQYEVIEVEQDANRSLHTLKVKKTVAGEPDDEDKAFSFSIKVYDDNENLDLSKYLSEHGGKYNESDGSYSLTLKHGEEVVIPDVPYGYDYEIAEDDYSEDGYSTKVNDKEGRTTSGKVVADKEYIFTNTAEPKEPANLTVKKKTEGNVAGEFEFEIRAWKGDKELDLSSELGTPDGDGYYHFTLKNAGEKTIPVPVGYQYEIVEVAKAGWELAEKTNDTGTIEEDVTAEFTNRSLHTLKVKKTVAGESGDENKDFGFSIKVYDGNENMDLSEYLSGHGGKYNESDGSYSLTLKHGEEAVIPDVPYGYNYEIKEDDYSEDGYSTRINDKEGRTTSGKVDADKEFLFTNTAESKEPASPTKKEKTENIVTGESGDKDKEDISVNTNVTEPKLPNDPKTHKKPTDTPKVKVPQKIKKAKEVKKEKEANNPHDNPLSDLKTTASKKVKHPNTRPVSVKKYSRAETGDDFSLAASAWTMVICSILLAGSLIFRRKKGRY